MSNHFGKTIKTIMYGVAPNASPPQKDGKIVGVDPGQKEIYTVKLSDGRKINRIPGPDGLTKGDPVAVGSYPGKAQRYFIIGKSYSASDGITEYEV